LSAREYLKFTAINVHPDESPSSLLRRNASSVTRAGPGVPVTNAIGASSRSEPSTSFNARFRSSAANAWVRLKGKNRPCSGSFVEIERVEPIGSTYIDGKVDIGGQPPQPGVDLALVQADQDL
jgi:hypothetical protein